MMLSLILLFPIVSSRLVLFNGDSLIPYKEICKRFECYGCGLLAYTFILPPFTVAFFLFHGGQSINGVIEYVISKLSTTHLIGPSNTRHIKFRNCIYLLN